MGCCSLAGAVMALALFSSATAHEIPAPAPIPTPYLKAGPRPFYLVLDGDHYQLDTSRIPFLFVAGDMVAAPGARMSNCRRRDGRPQLASAWSLFVGDQLDVVFDLAAVAYRPPRQADSPAILSVMTNAGMACDGVVPAPIDPADRLFGNGFE